MVENKIKEEKVVRSEKYINIGGKEACRLVIGTSRVASQKLPDGSFAADRTHDEFEMEILKFTLGIGYNFIDTARIYGDAEIIIGQAIKGIPRNKIVIATKAGFKPVSADQLRKEIDESCERLKTIPDIVLIHDRQPNLKPLVKVMDSAVDKGIVRAWGISNFQAPEIEEAVNLSQNGIAVYQAKVNLYHPRPDFGKLMEVCKKYNIPFMASSALDRGNLIEQSQVNIVETMKAKYSTTTAQCGILALLNKGLLPIVQSHNKTHIKENLNVFNIAISKSDSQKLTEIIGL